MQRFARRAAALLLSGALTFSAGCSGVREIPEQPAQGGGKAAAGRYVEKVCALPPGIQTIEAMLRLEDGEVELLAHMDEGPDALFSSKDGGETFTAKQEPWQQEVLDGQVFAYARAADGSVYLTYATRAQIDAVPEDDLSSFYGLQLLRQDAQGDVTQRTILDYQPGGDEDDGVVFFDFQIAQGGEVLSSNFDTVGVWDFQTLEETSQLSAQSPVSGILARGGTAILASGSQILFYNLATGEQEQALELPGGFYTAREDGYYSSSDLMRNPIDADETGGTVYYCDKTGIYRRLRDDSLTEQLVDGALTSLCVPSLVCEQFLALPDGSFLILYRTNNGYELMKYVFDAAMPVRPDTELTVYSLRESKTALQAIGDFQRQNPNVLVRFTAALDGETSLGMTDILRSLNTELLAGKGPDVLVLDGLPLESYAAKGVLRDLAPMIGENIASGEWMDKAAAFQGADGKAYAVPARFAAPLLLINSADAARAGDLTQFCAYVGELLQADPDKYPARFGGRRPWQLVHEFYASSAPALQNGDGTINADALSAFLSGLKRIADAAYLEGDEDEDFSRLYRQLAMGSVGWFFDQVPTVNSVALEMDDLAVPLSVINEKGGGTMLPMPGVGKKVYVPQCILGVNANNDKQELALSFIQTVLSQQVQDFSLTDGLPVNARSFDALAQEPGGEGEYDHTYQIGNDFLYQAEWPPQAQMQGLMDLVRSLDVPSLADTALFTAIAEESQAYFAGDETLEKTVSAISEKMALVNAEQQ